MVTGRAGGSLAHTRNEDGGGASRIQSGAGAARAAARDAEAERRQQPDPTGNGGRGSATWRTTGRRPARAAARVRRVHRGRLDALLVYPRTLPWGYLFDHVARRAALSRICHAITGVKVTPLAPTPNDLLLPLWARNVRRRPRAPASRCP